MENNTLGGVVPHKDDAAKDDICRTKTVQVHTVVRVACWAAIVSLLLASSNVLAWIYIWRLPETAPCEPRTEETHVASNQQDATREVYVDPTHLHDFKNWTDIVFIPFLNKTARSDLDGLPLGDQHAMADRVQEWEDDDNLHFSNTSQRNSSSGDVRRLFRDEARYDWYDGVFNSVEGAGTFMEGGGADVGLRALGQLSALWGGAGGGVLAAGFAIASGLMGVGSESVLDKIVEALADIRSRLEDIENKLDEVMNVVLEVRLDVESLKLETAYDFEDVREMANRGIQFSRLHLLAKTTQELEDLDTISELAVVNNGWVVSAHKTLTSGNILKYVRNANQYGFANSVNAVERLFMAINGYNTMCKHHYRNSPQSSAFSTCSRDVATVTGYIEDAAENVLGGMPVSFEPEFLSTHGWWYKFGPRWNQWAMKPHGQCLFESTADKFFMSRFTRTTWTVSSHRVNDRKRELSLDALKFVWDVPCGEAAASVFWLDFIYPDPVEPNVLDQQSWYLIRQPFKAHVLPWGKSANVPVIKLVNKFSGNVLSTKTSSEMTTEGMNSYSQPNSDDHQLFALAPWWCGHEYSSTWNAIIPLDDARSDGHGLLKPGTEYPWQKDIGTDAGTFAFSDSSDPWHGLSFWSSRKHPHTGCEPMWWM